MVTIPGREKYDFLKRDDPQGRGEEVVLVGVSKMEIITVCTWRGCWKKGRDPRGEVLGAVRGTACRRASRDEDAGRPITVRGGSPGLLVGRGCHPQTQSRAE